MKFKSVFFVMILFFVSCMGKEQEYSLDFVKDNEFAFHGNTNMPHTLDIGIIGDSNGDFTLDLEGQHGNEVELKFESGSIDSLIQLDWFSNTVNGTLIPSIPNQKGDVRITINL